MPSVVLIDTGPLVALVNEDDSAHAKCLDVLKSIPRQVSFITVLSVLTEAFHLVSYVSAGQEKLFQLMRLLRISLLSIELQHFERMEELISKYRDLPMDFADATIICAAEQLKIETIFTLDCKDFRTYRPIHIKQFSLLPKF